MLYKDFQGIKLSALGLGCMRLPTLDGSNAAIDEAKTAEMIAYAMEHGVNYYDTAWGYHSGNSETVVGKLLREYPRNSYYIATKFPGYDLSNMDKVKEIFPKQLEKTGMDYFDFYLFHNVCEANINAYLDPKHGIYPYLLEQKENGRIRHLGFSLHGTYETTQRFLEAYGQSMEFCQIQLNYLDWEFQEANEKIELLREHHIPIWVMEPLRGGRLARLDDAYTARLQAMRPQESAAGWAFRFLQTLPEVTVTLSGMSNLAQVRENIEIFSQNQPLSGAELSVLLDVAEDMVKKVALPCTACRYCTDHCPMSLDIPTLLEYYNEYLFSGGGFLAPMRVRAMREEQRPSACIGCRSCEQVCPQNIKISEAMADFSKKLAK